MHFARIYVRVHVCHGSVLCLNISEVAQDRVGLVNYVFLTDSISSYTTMTTDFVLEHD